MMQINWPLRLQMLFLIAKYIAIAQRVGDGATGLAISRRYAVFNAGIQAFANTV